MSDERDTLILSMRHEVREVTLDTVIGVLRDQAAEIRCLIEHATPEEAEQIFRAAGLSTLGDELSLWNGHGMYGLLLDRFEIRRGAEGAGD